jgi:peptidoglycan/xylan/chitin deacetylase (PgdA/CDA1 family)
VKRAYWENGPFGNQGIPQIPHHKEVKKRATGGDLSVALQWEEAVEMEASGLIDIQSHTHFHRQYFHEREKKIFLDPGKKEELLDDLKKSKERIEAQLRKKCRFLAWPWGKHNEEAVALATQVGYEGILTTEKGVNFPGSDPFSIKRIVAKSGDPGWFSTRIWIYSHPMVGSFYSRVVGKI